MKTTRILTHVSFLIVLAISAFFLSHWIGRNDGASPDQEKAGPATAGVGLPVADAVPPVESPAEQPIEVPAGAETLPAPESGTLTAPESGTLTAPESGTHPTPETPPGESGTRVFGTVEVAGVRAAGLEMAIGDLVLMTGEGGTFEVQLRHGLYPVHFPSLGKKTFLSVPEAASFETAFRLPGSASLSGTVRLADWRLGTVRVLVFRQESEGSGESEAIAETETAGDGTFCLDGLPSGAARVRFLLRGRVLREETIELPRGEWDVRILDFNTTETDR
ncbi:MAG: hypothetical protein HY720_19735 [Planctomycetes bacterium]|nr:hypothetical protein [Planctomycetota bacterium]